MDRKSYEKLIKEDLNFLDKHCPHSPELDHIKSIVNNSIDYNYPDREIKEDESKTMCIRDKTKVCNLCHECDVSILNPNY